MKDIVLTIIGSIFFLAVIIFIIENIKLVYRRYLKSYAHEIEDYLKKHNLTLYIAYSPTKYDWQNSPFPEPKKFWISFSRTRGVRWYDTHYQVIHTNEGKVIWLEIETILFKKPTLAFKTTGKRISRRKRNSKGIKIVTNTCPACGFHLSENDMECPDCGLNFR